VLGQLKSNCLKQASALDPANHEAYVLNPDRDVQYHTTRIADRNDMADAVEELGEQAEDSAHTIAEALLHEKETRKCP